VQRKRPRIERVWDGALEKVRREGRCRLCPEVYGLMAAHTLARKYDEAVELEDGSWAIFVDPDDVIALCPACHADYDARRVSVLEVLSYREQAAAVAHVGIVRALHRLSGQRMTTNAPLLEPPETRA
jgi:hypothetical protein